jgi:phosphoribosylformimino-5-aminoimidazole carboxamide ribotide isomerase
MYCKRDELVRIIPVIDLKGGIVVHGVAGQRARYQPIRSVLVGDPQPASVARAFADAQVFREIYVADLDAIVGGQPDWGSLRQIADSGLRIWLDAGVGDTDRLREFLLRRQDHEGVEAMILGLESLSDIGVLRMALAELGASHCIFSLDLRDGHPVTRDGPWQGRTPIEIASAAFDVGIRRLILLDVATVGTGRGPQSLELARRLRIDHPSMELIGGGGIRHLDDLTALSAAGFSAALVATALHHGTIPFHAQPEASALPHAPWQQTGAPAPTAGR